MHCRKELSRLQRAPCGLQALPESSSHQPPSLDTTAAYGTRSYFSGQVTVTSMIKMVTSKKSCSWTGQLYGNYPLPD